MAPAEAILFMPFTGPFSWTGPVIATGFPLMDGNGYVFPWLGAIAFIPFMDRISRIDAALPLTDLIGQMQLRPEAIPLMTLMCLASSTVLPCALLLHCPFWPACCRSYAAW